MSGLTQHTNPETLQEVRWDLHREGDSPGVLPGLQTKYIQMKFWDYLISARLITLYILSCSYPSNPDLIKFAMTTP